MTEKRTKAEIDGLADAYNEAMGRVASDDERCPLSAWRSNDVDHKLVCMTADEFFEMAG